MKKKTVLDIFVIVFLIIIILSAGYLVYINLQARNNRNEMKKLSSFVVKSSGNKIEKIKEVIVKKEETTGETVQREPEFNPVDSNFFIEIDFDALKSRNSDFTMWLYVPGTQIDFPVVTEKEVGKYYYDMVGFNERWNGAGTPLIPKSPHVDDFRTLILGHRMVNYYGSEDYLFSHIPIRWGDKESASKHQYVYTYDEKEVKRYRIYAGMPAYEDDMIYQTPYEKGTEDYQKLIDHVEDIAKYTIGAKPDKDTPTLMLSTCSRGDDERDIGRFTTMFVLDATYNRETNSITNFSDKKDALNWSIQNR